jgi:hypothetical protein
VIQFSVAAYRNYYSSATDYVYYLPVDVVCDIVEELNSQYVVVAVTDFGKEEV